MHTFYSFPVRVPIVLVRGIVGVLIGWGLHIPYSTGCTCKDCRTSTSTVQYQHQYQYVDFVRFNLVCAVLYEYWLLHWINRKRTNCTNCAVRVLVQYSYGTVLVITTITVRYRTYERSGATRTRTSTARVQYEYRYLLITRSDWAETYCNVLIEEKAQQPPQITIKL